MPKARAEAVQKTRIQARSEEAILDAALTVFSTYGYRGATVDQIAAEAGMSKPNLLYYFRRKEDIYVTLLERTLEDWLEPLKALDPDGEPAEELTRYITTKLEMSRDNPAASRLFANEILHGAPMIGDFLKGPLRRLVDDKAAVIRQWSELGRITAIDPYHLIFAIWATTQHYADFEVQVRAVTGKKMSSPPRAIRCSPS
ncbi:MAG: TetR family transcriptional regulator [Rhizobiales bacterium]|nr:TetR family transcriptional regulator [Hyphomicrobiales bacterium]